MQLSNCHIYAHQTGRTRWRSFWLWGKDKFVAGKVGVSYVFFSHIPLAPQKAFYNYILKKFVSEFLRKKVSVAKSEVLEREK